MGYTALEAGVRLLPMAITMLIVAPNSPKLAERFGTKRVVGTGLLLAGTGLALMSTLPAHDASYFGDVAWRLVIMATGMGLTMAPATESIMGSLPRAKAGVGSAVNDTTRQIGGAMGVAIIGSIVSSLYGPRITETFEEVGLSGERVEAAKDGLGRALEVASDPSLPDNVRAHIVSGAYDAFMAGVRPGLLVAAGVVLFGSAVVWKFLPARASMESVDG
jgi:MFS family permease